MTSRVSIIISFYDVGGSQSDRNIIIINDIHVDIKDYIVPAACNLEDFRQMRADFEWENKFTVNTTLTDLHKYIENLLGSTNMKCLTPAKTSAGDCNMVAANLYTKSIFGEDTLANVNMRSR
ncbi:hypothetical protein QYM36_014323 [Artemia franciscana]|uniref:Coatomer beta subunit appendage platform domain-containing protein n=1 Tax=Artemia franciscana TaxID=6661 RepID=A0AA88HQ04_ARTSF|nr:hypothetical protein QYM36_014323 [Artemia franciscana]